MPRRPRALARPEPGRLGLGGYLGMRVSATRHQLIAQACNWPPVVSASRRMQARVDACRLAPDGVVTGFFGEQRMRVEDGDHAKAVHLAYDKPPRLRIAAAASVVCRAGVGIAVDGSATRSLRDAEQQRRVVVAQSDRQPA